MTRSLSLCPVCGKKVGAWHAGGIHPKCQQRTPEKEPQTIGEASAQLTQAQRDRILRRLPSKTQKA